MADRRDPSRGTTVALAAAGLLLIIGAIGFAWIPRWWSYPATVAVGTLGGCAWGAAAITLARPDPDCPDPYGLRVLNNEIAWLWDQLDRAIHNSATDWDDTCTALARRITLLSLYTDQPIPWRDISVRLLEHGVYQRLYAEIGMHPHVDMPEVLRIADAIRASSPLTARERTMLTAIADGQSPVSLFPDWWTVLCRLESRRMVAIAGPGAAAGPLFSVRAAARGYLNAHRPDRRPPAVVTESAPIVLTKAAPC